MQVNKKSTPVFNGLTFLAAKTSLTFLPNVVSISILQESLLYTSRNHLCFADIQWIHVHSIGICGYEIMHISLDIHEKSVDVDIDMDVKLHIHGKPKACKVFDFRRRLY